MSNKFNPDNLLSPLRRAQIEIISMAKDLPSHNKEVLDAYVGLHNAIIKFCDGLKKIIYEEKLEDKCHEDASDG